MSLVTIRHLGSRFGAETVTSGPVANLAPRDLEDLKDALFEHKVLGLRGQHLATAEHRRFLTRLGTLMLPGSPPQAPGGLPADLTHVPAFARWVTAKSHLLAPPKIISLRATSPDVAGECSLFADAVGAYRDLPRPLRALADRSWATHGERRDGGSSPEDLVAHPVTRLHPETGDRTLLLGGHARRILGLSDTESRTVIHLLQSYLVRAHNVLRWDWQDGDLLLVDARSVQFHLRRAVGTQPATTTALEVAGDAPLGIDGQHSRRIEPAPQPERRSA